MALEVAIYHLGPWHRRSTLICNAMMEGIKSAGDEPRILHESQYAEPVVPIAVFYGLSGRMPKLLADYRAQGLKAVYIDLGYFGRHDGGRWSGFHKLAINSRHPTEYFQRVAHSSRRADALKVRIHPWRPRAPYILLAGMGDKGALAEGFQPEEWERKAIDEIRKYTDRPIIYRPKPSWKDAKPIEGTKFSPKDELLRRLLMDCHAVVTHHSNVAVDGLVDGIPAFCWEGVATPLSLQDLSKIEDPIRPDTRRQWVNDLAYTQFSIAEMHSGRAWRHLKDEGLIS
jgi:hypothetical protein